MAIESIAGACCQMLWGETRRVDISGGAAPTLTENYGSCDKETGGGDFCQWFHCGDLVNMMGKMNGGGGGARRK